MSPSGTSGQHPEANRERGPQEANNGSSEHPLVQYYILAYCIYLIKKREQRVGGGLADARQGALLPSTHPRKSMLLAEQPGYVEGCWFPAMVKELNDHRG